MYIETRKTWIKAIHGSIIKWQDIRNGLLGVEPRCDLCEKADQTRRRVAQYHKLKCSYCPVSKSQNTCGHHNSTWYKWSIASEREWWSIKKVAKPEAEAMLIALIKLLPPEERRRYEP
jgi:hypothetical protein